MSGPLRRTACLWSSSKAKQAMAVLGIKCPVTELTTVQVADAKRALVMQCHPDTGGSDGDTARFQRVIDASKDLTDYILAANKERERLENVRRITREAMHTRGGFRPPSAHPPPAATVKRPPAYSQSTPTQAGKPTSPMQKPSRAPPPPPPPPGGAGAAGRSEQRSPPPPKPTSKTLHQAATPRFGNPPKKRRNQALDDVLSAAVLEQDIDLRTRRERIREFSAKQMKIEMNRACGGAQGWRTVPS